LAGGVKVHKDDQVVKVMKECVRGRQSIHENEKKLKQLLDRINLDRPILQKEKIKLILFEKEPSTELES
jgi:hypothetical protein